MALKKVFTEQMDYIVLDDMSERLYSMSQQDEFVNNPDRSERIKKLLFDLEVLKGDVQRDGKAEYENLKKMLGEPE